VLSGRRKLLLADDSPTVQKVISLTFEDEGMEVVSASDGTEALRVLEEQRPDILLADVWMPGPNGYELCERVKHDARLRHIPVVLLVSKFEPFNEAEARRVGADTVLTKPFQSIRDLVSKVGSLLGGGGPKQEEAAAEQPRREGTAAPSAEASSAHDEAPAPHAESAAAGAPHGEQGETFHADFEPFADLGADDELIEAKPADSFGGAAHAADSAPHRQANAAPVEHDAASNFETSHAGAEDAAAREELGVLEHTEDFETAGHSPEVFADSHVAAFGTNGSAAAARGARPAGEARQPNWAQPTDEAQQWNESQPAHDFAASPADAGEGVMAARGSFAARAASASAADDALLDLGRSESRASRAAAEADDFILDLEEDLPAPQPAAHDADVLDAYVFNQQPAASAHADHSAASARPEAQSVFARPDEPSAFAEAAHGAPASSFGESAASFGESASAEVYDAAPSEVVTQGGPQFFSSPSVEHEAGPAPRGFVEPSVVPAEEPVPASVEGEFTDGSVEGDLPKPPAAVSAAPHVEEMTNAAAREVGAAHETPAPSEPSPAGFAVGEARAGVEEAPRAGQLSREDVDAVARRVVELMSDKVVREIAWEVVPELAELLVKRKLEEEKK
jgi:CheY-like chemotaxis protein